MTVPTGKLFSDVSVRRGSLTTLAVSFLRHGVNSGGVDPAIIKIEKRADRDRVVNGVIVPSHVIKRPHIVWTHRG